MEQMPLYPLRLQPIYQYRLWGGRRLGDLVHAALPGEGPIGEAWLLSDRDDHPSLVADGPFMGWTMAQLIAQYPQQMLGVLAKRFRRFPLLLKFLDVQQMLSVQVHPTDALAALQLNGESGKTEAWVVLEAAPGSRIYAGLKAGTGADDLRALSKRTVDDHLFSFTPKPGDGVFIDAGTVHSLGEGVLVFEVQENSDVTFRLYDWDHIDPRAGQGRPLQTEQALACVNFSDGPVFPVTPTKETQTPALRERLFVCPHFRLWRIRSVSAFPVGASDETRIVVCIEGEGRLLHGDDDYTIDRGGVMLIPAAVGACHFQPKGSAVLLEIAAPEAA